LENAFTPENARPAIYAFDGDVYTGVDAYSIPIEKLEKLQDSLRILSGLWVVETVGFNPGLSIRDGDEVAC
jgi:cytoplasmic iron level regulating protein YaaA (DUF328/UPF0246 family)